LDSRIAPFDDDSSSPAPQAGRCVCGNVGKPVVTIEGEIGFLCISCFVREAKGESAPRVLHSSTRFSKQGR
jgi:hypothetical protein